MQEELSKKDKLLVNIISYSLLFLISAGIITLGIVVIYKLSPP